MFYAKSGDKDMTVPCLTQYHTRHNNFDGLRLLFACLVLLSHGRDIFNLNFSHMLFYQAELAVNGFFIISGFLISWSIDRSFELKSYCIKRFARIYPLYAVVITVQLFLLWYFDMQETKLYDALLYYISNLATFNFIKPWYGTMVSEPINGSLWTIKVEIMFYMVIPVYIWLLRRFGLIWLCVSFALAFAWRFGLEPISMQWARQIPGSMAFFIAGCVGYFYGMAMLVALKHLKILALIGLIVTGLLFAAFENYYAMRLLYILVLATAIYVVSFHMPVIRMPVDISYGIYLWHVPIFLTIRHLWENSLPSLMLFIAGTISILLLAWASARCVEIPAIRWGRNRTRLSTDR